MELRATREVLLKRYGLVFFDDLSEGPELPANYVQAVELELAQLAYMPSARLAGRLRRLSLAVLAAQQAWIRDTLAAAVGAGVKHVPLFRSFPDGIPDDTTALWWRKVIIHFIQADDQPCLFCREVGTTHVLDPCRHVVCDRCFDGASYSACPVCEHHVDRSSPFFKDSPKREAGSERVRFKLLDVGPDLDAAARRLVVELCERKQAMSPDDVGVLTAVVGELREKVLAWLPDPIPVRENVAHVFGTLFRICDPARVLATAARYLKTATDVLRLVAAYSGADSSLQFEPVEVTVARGGDHRRWHGRKAARIEKLEAGQAAELKLRVRGKRFKSAKLSRPLRRALLGLLEVMPADALAEDMLRHRSTWEGLGEQLHPHEYAKRFPNVARAFQIVRGKGPNGEPAPAFRTYYQRLVAAMTARDVDGLVTLLEQRPGELARRYDHVLRIAGDDAIAAGKVMAAFSRHIERYSTPVLLGLRGLLPARLQPGATRVYWPKGAVSTGVTMPENRPALPTDVVAGSRRTIDDELLRRFGALPAFEDAILDDDLRGVIAPFNERTASRALVALPRGSRVQFEPAKTVRLFLHWCEPERGGQTTDIDTSVGFYDASWQYVGVCSWSQLKHPDDGSIAVSAGDLRSAPFPDGASEFIDVDRAAARAAGIRYCVMVVNNYRGLAFDKLERGFAGVMLRDDTQGLHFDPRTVKLRFDLAGENGVYLPFAIDLETDTMHWLDVYAKGMFELNTVATSNTAITTVCPTLIHYFASGVRPTMFELAALHAAARCRRVFVRGAAGHRTLVRKPDEAPVAFLRRLLDPASPSDSKLALPGAASPVFAALYRGDLELAEASTIYTLFAERAGATIAASSLVK